MMNEEPKELINYLSGKELLEANSSRAQISNEVEQTGKVLPKAGFKLFEPNGSWLQNRQIDACLEARRDLISIERVKRLSKLAVGEWLPLERRIKITKRSGVDWSNFGCDLRGTLYLNPEEALLQVELNCLDLFFNGVSLSIQQAYELLLNSQNSDCTLEEYRVYSQLAKLGYRLQRFYYEKLNEKPADSSPPKKKVIIDPENSKWMSGAPLAINTTDNVTKKDAQFVINSIIDKIEVEELRLEDKLAENSLNKIENDIKNKNKLKSKLNIVSVETMVDPVKLVAANQAHKTNDSNLSSVGFRIQRNVKLLPKRTDKISSSLMSYANKNSDSVKLITALDDTTNEQNNVYYDCEKAGPEKRKLNDTESSSSWPVTTLRENIKESLEEITIIPSKKMKNERVELSDDEIQEIPITLTRMEVLDCLPNFNDKNSIKVTIDSKYIPREIKLTKNVHEYDRFYSSDIKDNYNSRQAQPSSSFQGNRGWHHHRNNTNNYQRPHYQSGFAVNQGLPYNNMSYGNSSNYRAVNYSMANSNQSVSNRWSSLHVNFFKNIAMTTYALRASIAQGISDMYSSSFYPKFFGSRNSHYFNPASAFNYHQSPDRRLQNNSNHMKYNNDNSSVAINELLNDTNFGNYCSFEKLSANSWSELKKKWKDAKTITIEDDNDQVDCSEVEIVNHTIQPLVGLKYSLNLKQIYERLQIIKPAKEKLVRKKRGHYKISYKVYSNTQLYRKASPGQAMFHLVVTSKKNDNLLQPVDLNRLYQDGDGIAIVFACVHATSISYMQAGIVSLPTLIES